MKTCRELAVEGRKTRRLIAFTLIEVMIVVAIMAVVIGMGLPPLLASMRPQSMRKAVNDLREVCNNARARAILSGKVAAVVFHPKDRTFEVSGAGPGAGLSAKLPDDVKLDMLDINLSDCLQSESAQVKFFPNGTSDEMTVIFVSDKNERRAISLEVTTGLADEDTDVEKQMHK